MRPVYLGELGDEHRECEYCGTLVDALDRSSVTHEEEETYTDERGRRIRRVRRVTRHRADGDRERAPVFEPADTPRIALDGADGRMFVLDLSDPEAVREQLASHLGVDVSDVQLSDLAHGARVELESFHAEHAADIAELMKSVHGAREVVLASEIVDVAVESPPPPRPADPVRSATPRSRRSSGTQTVRESKPEVSPDLAWKIAIGAGGALTLGGLSTQHPFLAVAALVAAVWVWRQHAANRG